MSRALWFYPRAKQLRRVGGCVAPASLMALLGISGVARGRLGANWEARLARVGGLALPLHDRALDNRRCGTGGAKRLHLCISLGYALVLGMPRI
ncbi:hypothetical protein [Synechococcus sp. PCC 7336]|uniref:hypothetical protein n=2 Tax=Synechococcus sp. PCC 7336 TaxID=195250 RepID=UPI0012EA08B4|nr:hypothetical protein [Synechococcus sp. PCC 7336]